MVKIPIIWRIVLLAILVEGLLIAFYGPRGHAALNIPTVLHALRIPESGIDSTRWMSLAENRFRSGDHRIYPELFFAEHEKYLYPPSALFVMEILSHSPANTWKTVMVLVWIVSLGAGILLWRLVRGRLSISDAAAVFLLGVLFRPFGMALIEGQVQLVIIACFGVSLLLWQSRLGTSSGATLSLTCIFKPQLGLFLLWGLLRRQRRFVIGFALVIGVILVASILHFGWRNHLDYLSVLNYLNHHGEAYYPNQSLNGMLNRLLHNGDASTWSFHEYAPYNPLVYWPCTIFSVACVTCGLWLPVRDGWQGTLADLLFFGCLTTLVSPIAWPHHYGVYYFLVIYLLAKHEQLFAKWRWLWLAFSYIVMVDRFPRLDTYLYGLPSLMGNYLFLGSILALVILIWAEKVSNSPAAKNSHSES